MERERITYAGVTGVTVPFWEICTLRGWIRRLVGIGTKGSAERGMNRLCGGSAYGWRGPAACTPDLGYARTRILLCVDSGLRSHRCSRRDVAVFGPSSVVV